MKASPPSPPRWVRRLLVRLLPPEDRESFPLELDEVYRRRAARNGRVRAGWWYLRQVVEVAGRLGLHRASAATRDFDMGTFDVKRFLDGLSHDLRHAGRGLLRRPLFAAVAVLSLGLAIGGNTAAFSVVNAVLLRSLPVEDPDGLVEVYTSDSDGEPHSTFSYPDFEDLEEASEDVFEGVAAYRLVLATTERDRTPVLLMGEAVSAGYFEILGVRPAVGRTFELRDAGPPGEPARVVLGHGYWLREFGGDRDVVGRTLRLNGLPYTVVGVASESFAGMTPALESDFWVPMTMVDRLNGSGFSQLETRGSRSLFVKARLGEEVTVDRANEWLDAFSARLAEAHPETNENRRMSALPTRDVAIHPTIDRALFPAAALLLGAVGLVLIITCANLASFLLARAEDRRREIAVRKALGASRWRLLRGSVLEALLLAALGCLLGVFVADGLLSALLNVELPVPLPVNLDLGIDRTVLGYAVAIAGAAGLAFGGLPALGATGGRALEGLTGERAPSGPGPGRSRLRRGLVAAQVTLSLVLMVGAGLFVRSLGAAESVDPGFDTGPGAIVWPNLRLSGVGEEEGAQLWDEIERRLLAHPAIEEVGLTDALPLGAGVQSLRIDIPDVPSRRPDGMHSVDYAHVSPGFFEAMDVEIVKGRNFRPGDTGEGGFVAIVSEAFERRFFPQGALGRTLNPDREGRTIVGVAADTKVRTLGEDPRPKLYLPVGALYLEGLNIVVRGRGSGPELLAAARSVLDEVRPGLVVFEAKTMAEHLGLMLFAPRLAALLLTGFGVLALLLATIGLYGVMSYSVARRTREMGVRLSLGASAVSVRWHVIREAARMVVPGVLIGLPLAALAGTTLSGFLIGVPGTDPVTFTAVPVAVLLIGLLATWLPARRATRLDPAEVLRVE